ncbi:MAG: phosphatidylglycerophosphatase A [Deltaproteobacteria bacterium]|nr:phosphatidylglycerophosphatase A [Deltaproteobacteria bacterium]
MIFKQRVILFLATGFYAGKVPVAPGTFGTFVGLVFCFFLSRLDTAFILSCIALIIAFSVWIADKAEKLLARKDPGEIVIDEIAGIMVTMAFLPFTAFSALFGFIIFRFIDILKPFPIRYLEKKVPGGAGIVVDDIAAGVVGNIVLRIVLHFIDV